VCLFTFFKLFKTQKKKKNFIFQKYKKENRKNTKEAVHLHSDAHLEHPKGKIKMKTHFIKRKIVKNSQTTHLSTQYTIF
jgi:hypothetical protein